jgi:anti-anti-sigma factor
MVLDVHASPPVDQHNRFGVTVLPARGRAATTIAVNGELDGTTSSLLVALGVATISAREGEVTVDLAQLDFVGTDGVRAVQQLCDEAERLQRTIRVVNVTPTIARLFEMVGCTDVVRPTEVPSAIDSARRTAHDVARYLHTALGDVVAVSVTATEDSASGGTDPRHGAGRASWITLAATDAVARRLDEAQYATGTGPCLDACLCCAQTYLADTDDEPRWPEFAAAALQLGIGSVLSTPFGHLGAGSLNVYSRRVADFDGPRRQLAARFAASVEPRRWIR